MLIRFRTVFEFSLVAVLGALTAAWEPFRPIGVGLLTAVAFHVARQHTGASVETAAWIDSLRAFTRAEMAEQARRAAVAWRAVEREQFQFDEAFPLDARRNLTDEAKHDLQRQREHLDHVYECAERERHFLDSMIAANARVATGTALRTEARRSTGRERDIFGTREAGAS